MAYSLGNRFPPPPKCCMLLDPGAYQNNERPRFKPNKAPFLSNNPRKTLACGKLWTHAIYFADLPPKIRNCTSMISTRPRFPYEAFSKEDLENILCRCGFENPCECPAEGEEPVEILCQAKVKKCIFKGPPPHSIMGEGLSSPSKKDNGFEILPDGRKNRIRIEPSDESPPFYDARVIESTEYYHGCKWSKWTSKRSIRNLDKIPGPADYNLIREPTESEKCAEKVRFYRRRDSKQPRFIEIVQQRNILEGRPGPSDYTPMLPKGVELSFLGPKACRFPRLHTDDEPGPADYWVKRDFDLPECPTHLCHAKLPEPACFGMKAQRFKPRKEEGPSPASYCPNYKPCQFVHCPTAAFGSSAIRFKETPIESDSDEDVEPDKPELEGISKACPALTWEFKSKTVRMKPLRKVLDEPSPADLPQPNYKIGRTPQLQYNAPFFASEGRFQPWYNSIPVHGKENTPGPCYYNLEKPRCLPAVNQGPLYRAKRFPACSNDNPAPNEYKVGRGLEIILNTHNQRLKNNIDKQHKFHWEPPLEPKKLSITEQETLLINKSIALCEPEDTEIKVEVKPVVLDETKDVKGEKMLRCFLYNKKVPNYG